MQRALTVLTTLFITLRLTAAEVGPPQGHLVIAGGDGERQTIPKRFVSLAGGAEARLVIIPTAQAGEEFNRSAARLFAGFGITNITHLHTRDRKLADSEEFVAPLRTATAVWFRGGRQWRLADSYLGTKVQRELEKVLERGGVIGGDSAGATIMGSYLVRGDTRSNLVMMGDHEEGFGYLKNVAIDQHLLRRNRQFDMIEVINARPELLGIGIDESTAIVVSGDRFEVIGRSYVAVYDHGQMKATGKPFRLLSPGQVFDLRQRRVVVPRRPRTR